MGKIRLLTAFITLVAGTIPPLSPAGTIPTAEDMSKQTASLEEEMTKMAAGMEGGVYEWIVAYDEIKHFLEPSFLKTSHTGKTMVLGCGTSELGADLAASGYKDVVNVDIDDKPLQSMRKRHAGKDSLTWVAADMTNAKGVYPEGGIFEAVIDKATFDALMCTDEASHLYCEVHRVLRVGGVYVVISFRPRPLMEKLLVAPGACFELETHAIPRSAPPSLPPLRSNGGDSQDQREKHGHVYVLRKGAGCTADLGEIKAFQDEVIRWWHNEQDPLLSAEDCDKLKTDFGEELKKRGLDPAKGRLPIKEAHGIMFEGWLKDGEYGYDLEAFMEDLRAFDEDCVVYGGLTAVDAVGFMKEMQ